MKPPTNGQAVADGLQSGDHGRLPGPWIMHMTWHDLLFAHWPVQAEALRALAPRGLEIETFDGWAWVGLVPFHMTGIRLRGLPPMPGTGAFVEMNVRTYVTDGRRVGVWFFTLDAASRLAVRIARRWYRLNYLDARMRCVRRGGWVEYESRRRCGPAEFVGRYHPVGDAFAAEPGTLEHFLTERYCLYAADGRGRLYRAEIQHVPWPLQRAEWEARSQTAVRAAGITPADSPPHLLYAQRVDVRAGPPRRV